MSLAETLVCHGQLPVDQAALAVVRVHQVPHVVSARVEDATVLMDRRRGTYFTLNEVSSRAWELLGSGSTISALIERLLEEYDVPRQQLEADVVATIQQFLADKLVAPGSVTNLPSIEVRPSQPAPQMGESSRELWAPSVLACGVMLLGVKVLLKVGGYGRTIDQIRRSVEGVQIRAEVDGAALKVAEYRVSMAGALYPGRALCLEQSLVLYYLLRRQGVGVNYCQGVQPRPFQAHAWVEYRGEVINDVAEHVQGFVQLPSLLP